MSAIGGLRVGHHCKRHIRRFRNDPGWHVLRLSAIFSWYLHTVKFPIDEQFDIKHLHLVSLFFFVLLKSYRSRTFECLSNGHWLHSQISWNRRSERWLRGSIFVSGDAETLIVADKLRADSTFLIILFDDWDHVHSRLDSLVLFPDINDFLKTIFSSLFGRSSNMNETSIQILIVLILSLTLHTLLIVPSLI